MFSHAKRCYHIKFHLSPGCFTEEDIDKSSLQYFAVLCSNSTPIDCSAIFDANSRNLPDPAPKSKIYLLSTKVRLPLNLWRSSPSEAANHRLNSTGSGLCIPLRSSKPLSKWSCLSSYTRPRPEHSGPFIAGRSRTLACFTESCRISQR